MVRCPCERRCEPTLQRHLPCSLLLPQRAQPSPLRAQHMTFPHTWRQAVHMEAAIVRILQDCPQKQRQEASGMKGNFHSQQCPLRTYANTGSTPAAPIRNCEHPPSTKGLLELGDKRREHTCTRPCPERGPVTVLSSGNTTLPAADCTLSHVSQPFPVILHLPCSCKFPCLPSPPFSFPHFFASHGTFLFLLCSPFKTTSHL